MDYGVLPRFSRYTGQKVRIIQNKMDGHYVRIVFNGNDLMVTTKNGIDITDKFCVLRCAEPIETIPDNTVLHAELWWEGHATSVPTKLNENSDDLNLSVFAAPILGGMEIIDYEMPELEAILHDYDFDFPEWRWFNHDSHCEVSLSQCLIEGLQEKALSLGQEGYVLKYGHWDGWYKLKPHKEVDVFVVFASQSFEAQYYGGLKSINVAVYKPNGRLRILGDVGGGFDEDYRKEMEGRLDELPGRVATVRYDEIAANGSLKWPRFVCWRDDKDPKQCTEDQLNAS